MENDDQLDLFSFFQQQSDAAEKKAETEKSKPLSRQELQQLALGFLASQKPDALAMQVPARFHKYQVTCAGFWRGSGKEQKTVAKTAIVVLYEKFERCFNDCANRDLLLKNLRELRLEREKMEAQIRQKEPELASKDDLFSDFCSWNYAASRNAEYHKVHRKIKKLQAALHQGSRLSRIHGTGVADSCYLAVPAGLVQPDEIALGWGLVYLGPGREFQLVKEADPQEATPAGRELLAHNIAVAGTGAVCFAAGVEVRNKSVIYRKLPRKKKRLS